METGGTILISQDEESSVKMTLSSEGYPRSALNYDIFKNNSGFMTTDFEKKKYLLFQLQNRLQDAIKTIRGVKNAIVTLSIPEEDSFVLKEDKIDPSASVVVDLSVGTELSEKQVKGIESLVAKSVPGLLEENVAVVGTDGLVLGKKSSGLSEDMAGNRLEIEKAISSEVEGKVTKLLAPIFGSGSLRVAVNTAIDLDRQTSDRTTYEPVVDDKGIIASQEFVERKLRPRARAGFRHRSNDGVPSTPKEDGQNDNGLLSEKLLHHYLVSGIASRPSGKAIKSGI